MTSSIFQFLIDFASVLGNMATELWAFLNNTITIGDDAIPVWALLGTGGVIVAILLNIIKSIIL